MKQIWKKLLSVLLAAALLLTFAPLTASAEEAAPAGSGARLEFTEVDPATIHVPKLGDLAAAPEEEEALPEYGLNDLVRVSIVLEAPSTLEQGYSTQGIAQNTNAIACRNALKAQQDALAQKISDEILGTKLDVRWNITLAGNIISANVPYGKLEAIRALDGVKSVELENRYEPMKSVETDKPTMTKARDMVGADGPNASGYKGAGERLAVIDTGLDHDHQSFNADAFMHAIEQTEGAADLLLTEEQVASLYSQLNFGSKYPSYAAQAYMNAKIPYHANYVDHNMTTNHENDTQEEHGSHVCGISAANRYLKQGDEYVDAAETVGVVGEAPDAQIFVMKVFGSGGGAYDSDYMVAIEDAIILGADCVNLSLGSSAPGSTIVSSSYRNIMDNLIVNSDTVVSISMGNNEAWDDNTTNGVGLYADDINFFTGGSPGSYTNALTVASIDDSGVFAPYIRVAGVPDIRYLEGGGAANNAPLTTVGGDYQFIYLDGPGVTDSDADQFAPLAELVTGKIAICNRGSSSFYQKGNAAVEAGAVATIIVNNQPGTISMALDGYSYTNPCVSVKREFGAVFKAAATETATANGVTYYIGSIKIGGGDDLTQMEYYEMSSYSSWGVAGSLVLKPEITAPGGGVLSLNGYHRNASGGGYSGGHDEYELMSGTSMAAPQINGLTAALGQYYRENGIGEKTGLSKRQFATSLLMSTAVPVVEEASNNYYSLLSQGAGLANLENAVTARSFILMDESATTGAADGKVKAELGDDPAKTGVYSYKFKLTNFADEAVGYELSTDLFTQAVKTVDGDPNRYLDHLTRDLDGDVSYLIEYPAVRQIDVNKDGETNINDGQAILDTLTGKYEGEFDEDAADYDGDGEITTWDAYQLLQYAEQLDEVDEISGLVLEPGGCATVTVSITLSDEEKARLAEEGRKGAYVEGFTYVTSANGEDRHSIPVLGFYGSWTDPSMFDAVDYVETLYGTTKKGYWNANSSASNSNNMYIRYNGSGTDTSFTGNPYFVEDEFPADRLAISGTANINQIRYNLIRDAGSVGGVITDEENNVLYATSFSAVGGAWYNTNASTPSWQSTSTRSVSVNRTVESLGIAEGGKITAKVYALPEYYGRKYNDINSAGVTSAQFAQLLKAGVLGEGAGFGFTFTVDNTAPVLDTDNTVLDTDANTLTVTASDNQYIANMRIMDVSGKQTYFSVLPEQTAPGQTVSHVFELGEIELGNAINVFIADYAGNETTLLVRLADGPIMIQKEVYVQTSTLEAGKEYLITNTMNPGSGYALGRNGTSAARDAVTIKAADASWESPYILGDGVDATSVWTADASGDGFKLKNGDSWLRANGSWSVSLQIAANDTNNVWTWDAENNRLSVSYNNRAYYLRYNNNNFSINTATNSVYLYEKQTYSEEFDPEKATEVTVTPASSTIYSGGTVQLSAAVAPLTVPDKSVTWQSSDETIATVDADGVVTGVSGGSVTITAESVKTPGVTGTATVTVKQSYPIDATINAQIADGSGPSFVKIDLNNGSTEKLGDAAGTHYGGGRSGSLILGFMSNGTVIETIVTDEGYDSYEAGAFGSTSYNARDGAHIPTVSATVGEETVTEDYDSIYLASSYLLLYKSATGSITGWNFSGYTAIAYDGTDAAGNHYYYMLNRNGQLLSAMVGPDEDEPITTDDGTGDRIVNLALSTSSAAAISGLSSSAGTFGTNYMSMSVVETDTLYGLLIANTNTREIYFVDLTGDTLTATLVAGFPNATSLTTLYDDNYDVNVIPVETEGVGARLRAEAKAAAKAPAELKQSLEAVNKAVGGTNAVRTGYVFDMPGSDTPAQVEQPLTYVTVSADEADTSNGLITVEFDPVSAELWHAVPGFTVDYSSTNWEEGKVTFAYVDTDARTMERENVLELYFNVKSATEIKITTNEINRSKPGTVETVTVGGGAPVVPLYGDPVWTWTFAGEDNNLSDTIASATFTSTNTDDVQTLVARIESGTVVMPTCTEQGSYELIATVVFQGVTYTDTQTRPLKALGHSYGEPTFVWADDYSSAVAVFTCSRCADEQTDDTVTVSVETVDPGCETAGQITYTATATVNYYIGDVLFDTVVYTDVKTVAIAALGHAWDEGEATIAATCTGAGITTFTCTRCNETRLEAVDPLGHTPEDVAAVDPTCTTAGLTAGKKCSVCGAILSGCETVLPAGHTAVAIPAVAPTCTETGLTAGVKCAVCGEILTAQQTVEALGHKPIKLAAVAPTCTEPGLTEGSRCAVCGEILTAQQTVEPTGHTLVMLPAVAATCTTDGLTPGWKCSVCNVILTEQQVVPASGHTPVTMPAIAPSCTTPGLSEGSRCSVCNAIITAQTTVPAKGHRAETIPAVAATCTTAGLTAGSKCADCGAILTAQQAVPAKGHSWNSGAITAAPSCTAKGIRTYTCTFCNETRVEAIDAAGHKSQNVAAVAATCTSAGSTAGTKCSVCGAIITGCETVPAKGHTITAIAAVPATCIAGGKTEGAKCSVCNEVIVAQKDVAALGHSYGAAEITKAPTAKAEGELTITCARCGDKKTESIAKLGGLGLELFIAVAKELETANCTEESAAALAAAITAAEAALETATTQAALDEALTGLLEAIEGLEENAFQFDDVKDPEAYYYDAVYWAFYHEPQVTTGTSDTTFGPGKDVTRGQAVTFLWRAAGEPKATSSNNPFEDVKESAFYYDAVLWAVEKGITTGTSSTKFTPNGTCTKAHIITFIWRWLGEPAATGASPFTDVTESNWYYKSALWANENGLVDEATGVTADKFNPLETCTRGATVTFLYRASGE